MLHDLDDRLFALADRDEVELVDKGLGLAGRIRTADHRQRLSADLRCEREGFVLHGDHAVDADHRRPEPLDLLQHLAALEERVVDVSHAVTRTT